ncbi:MAG TPA: STAS domain-containing protein [Candidatus Eremiobacteraceae bacterium]|nr:STAS domain-containing protein [Candidatus Eremiobacteraceae bacterium]
MQQLEHSAAGRKRGRRRVIPTDQILVGERLDAQSAKRFARSMSRLVESGSRDCIIDLSKTEAVDSSGFGSLIAAVRKIGDIGGVVAIVCSNTTVRRLFEVAGLTRFVPVVPRIEDARLLLSASARAALAS